MRILVFIFIFSGGLLANQPPACDSEEHRQFDFWLGTWDVYSKDGKKVGVNEISSSMKGCVLKEHYITPTGFEGESFNIYDRTQKKWHQTWVDNTGSLLELDGKWSGKTMTLMGEGRSKEGKKIIHRIQWKPKKNGDVHQVWDSSKDNGLHWESVFYGVYQKQTKG